MEEVKNTEEKEFAILENKMPHSEKYLKKRKFLVMLPVLVLPFITMGFWALGGGSLSTESTKKEAGLNPLLPSANLKDESMLDKLSFYKQADADSLKRAEYMRNDPYYRNELQSVESQQAPSQNGGYHGLNPSPYNHNLSASEQKIYQQINALTKVINEPEIAKNTNTKSEGSSHANFSQDVDRLENMMHVMSDKQEGDPEMQQLNGTLDKILQIQHPEKLSDHIKGLSKEKKSQVFTVSIETPATEDTVLQKQDGTEFKSRQSFYEESLVLQQTMGSIVAFNHETKIVTEGSTIKLRLGTDVYIAGLLIRQGSFVYGIVTLENERLRIIIPGIRYQDNLLPVSLSAYDMDGLEGINVPGSINQDVGKQSTEQSLQSIELMSLDPSLKAQAASAGLSAAKSLLTKKVKQVKITLKAGYKMLLKDINTL